MSPDIVNAMFEAGGTVAVLLSCRRLYHDKQVRGVSMWAVGFFAAWGAWNLFYYPHLQQWWSFAAGVGVMVANLAWIIMAIYYRCKAGRSCE